MKAAEIWGTEMTAGACGVVLEFDSFWNKIVTVASPLCECTKALNFTLKMMTFMAYSSYLNKAILQMDDTVPVNIKYILFCSLLSENCNCKLSIKI